MADLLVTGANGFIGVPLLRALGARGDTVTALDIQRGPALAALCAETSTLRFVQGTVTERSHLAGLLMQSKPAAVIHCAALVGSLATLDTPAEALRVNVEGTLNVLEAMRLAGVPRLINLSTEEVYGAFDAESIDETHPCRPQHPYGITKYAAEQFVRDYQRRFGVEAVSLRTCWVYGPGLPRPRVPKNLIDAALAGTPLHLPRGGDFRVDQIHVDDVVAGILGALDLAHHPHDAYHLSTGVALPLSESVAIVRELVPGADLSIGPGDYAFGAGVATVRKGALRNERAREAFGFRPRYTLRSGLAAYLEATREQLRGG